MASLNAIIREYDNRPALEITPAMVIAGANALRAGLEDTAARVFLTMMHGQPMIDVTPRMRAMGAELIRLRPDLDSVPLAAEICLVMFEEWRLGRAWSSKHAPEQAIPRSIEMLSDSSAQVVEHDDTLVLLLPARPPAARGLTYIGPRYICLNQEAVAQGRTVLNEGLEATAVSLFRAVLGDHGLQPTSTMARHGANAIVPNRGLECDDLAADVVSEMASWHVPKYRCEFTALRRDGHAGDAG